MVSVELTVIIGGIIKLMLTLQVSCNDFQYEVYNYEMVSGGGFEYFVSTEARNWADSRNMCRRHGQQLVVLRTGVQMRAFIRYIKSNGWRNVNFWIHTCYKESGLICQRDCTEVSVDNQSFIRIHRPELAPCSKHNLYVCEY